MRGHLRKRSKSSWSIALTFGRDENGKLKQKWYTQHGTKKDAELKLNDLLHKYGRGDYIEPSALTLGQFIDKWLSNKKSKVSPKTYHRYEQWCKQHINPRIGNILLQNLTAEVIDNLYSDLRTEGRLDKRKGGLSERSVWHCHRVLNNVLSKAVQWRYLQNNPLKYLEDKPSNITNTGKIQVLDSKNCFDLLVKAKSTLLYVPISIAIATGLRRGEILGLKWSDLDVDNHSLTISRAVYEVKDNIGFKSPKSNKARSVVVPNFLIDALKSQKTELSKLQLQLGCRFEEDLICPDLITGGIWRPSSFTSAYRSFVRKNGFESINFHALRHSHASLLLDQGENIKLISKRLGHSTTKITLDLYSHLLPETEQNAVDRFEENLMQNK